MSASGVNHSSGHALTLVPVGAIAPVLFVTAIVRAFWQTQAMTTTIG
ncbi:MULTISPECIES: hypothetical protein [unclassified Cryobacterium]|nr:MULTISPECIES: hypothetical protein [unclassified Cryobacterium]